MAKKKTKPSFAPPDIERDKKELVEFYVKDYLPSDDDEEGLGPEGIKKLGQLTKTLADLKKKKK